MHFTVNSTQENSHMYPLTMVCQIIAQYIMILKGVKVTVNIPNTRKEIELFEKAANYAIPAYEGGWKLKTNI